MIKEKKALRKPRIDFSSQIMMVVYYLYVLISSTQENVICSFTFFIAKKYIFIQLTGRVEERRRWSDGIHQAVEAKEGLEIQVILLISSCLFSFIYKLLM